MTDIDLAPIKETLVWAQGQLSFARDLDDTVELNEVTDALHHHRVLIEAYEAKCEEVERANREVNELRANVGRVEDVNRGLIDECKRLNAEVERLQSLRASGSKLR
ncbi:MAG: hypothetical protein OEU92_30005 [Alphaproteobacteria bacterium]|nr:hypothetical protein [Alphaproteobacteria bacterium]